MITKNYSIKLKLGLHARPSSALITQILNFNLDKAVILWNNTEANMRSIINVLSLGIPHKEEFLIKIAGPDEQRAIEFLDIFFNLENEDELYAKYDSKNH